MFDLDAGKQCTEDGCGKLWADSRANKVWVCIKKEGAGDSPPKNENDVIVYIVIDLYVDQADKTDDILPLWE